jgi:NADH dehydrogenase
VTAISARGVTVQTHGRDERIGARTVIWAAGVHASPLAASLGAPRDPSGRVEVRPDLSIPDHPEVFVIGDLAKMVMADGTQVPGVAQGALQGGRHVAKLIATEVASGAAAAGPARPARPAFRYHDKGNMATVGRAEAVIATKHFARHGLLAWLLWWAIHIFFLVGFRNRLLMMFHWGWSWLTFRRGARLITGTIGALPPIRSIGPDGQIALPPSASPVTLDDDAAPHKRSPTAPLA